MIIIDMFIIFINIVKQDAITFITVFFLFTLFTVQRLAEKGENIFLILVKLGTLAKWRFKNSDSFLFACLILKYICFEICSAKILLY